jgi:hypothetical protein
MSEQAPTPHHIPDRDYTGFNKVDGENINWNEIISGHSLLYTFYHATGGIPVCEDHGQPLIIPFVGCLLYHTHDSSAR